jgi:7-carboxy-7-deazaguanine synthase
MSHEILHINDLFWTLQGEGTNAGRRALFVRLPFCNLTCTWCDTSFNSFKRWSMKAFLEFAQGEPGRFAVITGGEPMLNKHAPIVIAELKALGFEIAVESNGTVPPCDGVDFLTVSPKRFTAEKGKEPYYVHPLAMAAAKEFKYVVDADFDWGILDRHDVRDGRRYSLSPEFGNFETSVNLIIQYLQRRPEWRLSLQTHKWIGVA